MAFFRNTALIIAWFGIILPSCPCKVMSLFGVNLHASAAARPLQGNCHQLSTPNTPGVPCHCDQEVEEVADLAEDQEPADGKLAPGTLLCGDIGSSITLLQDPATGHLPIRPPPDPALSLPAPERSFFGVYRL
ncbi:MAG: hypothetical protein O3A87_02180 [Verrucomicrobia bacterium]|nr:hypothetical protein [Verrucomicrobiota bacterium]MDA1005278.1 hypothetical protein [Verrucomicrobiota bacterium]